MDIEKWVELRLKIRVENIYMSEICTYIQQKDNRSELLGKISEISQDTLS